MYGLDGEPFAQYTRHGLSDTFVRPEYRKGGHEFTGDYLVVYSPIKLQGEAIGTICIQSSLMELNKSIEHNVMIVLFVALIATLGAYLLSSRLQRLISVPISHLAKTTMTISEEEDYLSSMISR